MPFGDAPSEALPGRPDVLMIDNYDSFTYNLVQYLEELGAKVLTRRHDQISLDEIHTIDPRCIVVSPGPGAPRDAGISCDAIRAFAGKVPILGVCLGLQCMFEVFGGTVTHAGEIVHGKTSEMFHDGRGVFEGIPSPFKAVRYHSLAGRPDTLPSVLEVTCRTSNGIIQGVRHTDPAVRLEGVQFHPESILTEHGKTMLANFLRWGGIGAAAVKGTADSDAGQPEGAASDQSGGGVSTTCR